MYLMVMLWWYGADAGGQSKTLSIIDAFIGYISSILLTKYMETYQQPKQYWKMA